MHGRASISQHSQCGCSLSHKEHTQRSSEQQSRFWGLERERGLTEPPSRWAKPVQQPVTFAAPTAHAQGLLAALGALDSFAVLASPEGALSR